MKRLSQDPAFDFLTVRGVPVRVHASVLFLPLWAAYAGVMTGGDGRRGALFMLSYVILLYVCAACHELGHILVAARHGARINRIRISGLGAFVQVISPEVLTPRQDFMVAIAGPIASALLAALCCAWAWPILAADGLFVVLQRDWRAMVVALAATNVLLAVFNLLPVLPMDGGRALHAFLLARHLPAPVALQLVSRTGQVAAAAAAAAALVWQGELMIRFTVVITAALVFLVSSRVVAQAPRAGTP